jgi:hypothetical protein
MSSSNKAGITIGVVVGAVVVAGGIGVWVFRKWKLSVSTPLLRVNKEAYGRLQQQFNSRNRLF